MSTIHGPAVHTLAARTLLHREKRLQRTAPAVVHAQLMHDGQYPARQCAEWCAWNERKVARDHAHRAMIRALWLDYWQRSASVYWQQAARLAAHHVMR